MFYLKYLPGNFVIFEEGHLPEEVFCLISGEVELYSKSDTNLNENLSG